MKKFFLFLTVIFIILGIYYLKFVENENVIETFFILIQERNFNVMSGRDFDNIPNFSNNDLGFLYRSFFWPIFFLSGTFIFFTENVFFKILGIEIILMQIFTYICHRKIILNFGLIILLIIISLWVTTFTSFYRYAYLGFLALFLQKIFNTKIRNKM